MAAKSLCEAAVAAQPRARWAWWRLGEVELARASRLQHSEGGAAAASPPRPNTTPSSAAVAGLGRAKPVAEAAVLAFQNAIRATPSEAGCWDGLARAYLACGRLSAAQKVGWCRHCD